MALVAQLAATASHGSGSASCFNSKGRSVGCADAHALAVLFLPAQRDVVCCCCCPSARVVHVCSPPPHRFNHEAFKWLLAQTAAEALMKFGYRASNSSSFVLQVA